MVPKTNARLSTFLALNIHISQNLDVYFLFFSSVKVSMGVCDCECLCLYAVSIENNVFHYTHNARSQKLGCVITIKLDEM